MSPTIATFNIRHGRGLDDRVDLERTAAVLRATQADLIVLQEVDRGMARTGGADQPARLAELSGTAVHFFPTLTRGRGHYGIAIASADELDPTFHPFDRLADEEPRGFIRARWRGVTVFGTHLSLQRPANRAHMRALAAAVGATEGPVVVLGDMNAPRPGLKPLVEAGLAPSPDRHQTLNHPWRRRQIDHVLAGHGVRVIGSRTVASDASDHRALVAGLELL